MTIKSQPCADRVLCKSWEDRIQALTPTWKTTLDFSSRYVLMLAPTIWFLSSKLISVYFPNRLLLSLRVVLALPTA